MHIDHLIVATDLSDNSGIAAKWAASAAPKFDADVTVLHVVETGFISWLKSDLDVFDDEGTMAKLRQTVKDWYHKHTDAYPDHIEVHPGSPLVQIRNAVERKEAPKTMVVLARSSKGGFEKFFLGSTVHQVVADPPCSIAVVHPDHAEATGLHPIVTGTDFSENADLAVQVAIDMCESLNGTLHLVHANQIPQSTAYAQIGLGGVDMQDRLRELATQKMDTFIEKEVQAHDVEVEKDLILDEPAAEALLHVVENDQADILVVGHNGASPLVQNVLGSVTQQVLRNIPTTIIIVPVDTAVG